MTRSKEKCFSEEQSLLRKTKKAKTDISAEKCTILSPRLEQKDEIKKRPVRTRKLASSLVFSHLQAQETKKGGRKQRKRIDQQKGRKQRKRIDQQKQPIDQSEVVVQIDQWVECSKCFKWRIIKKKKNTTKDDLSGNWECSMNTDKTQNNCNYPSPAEIYEDPFENEDNEELREQYFHVTEIRVSTNNTVCKCCHTPFAQNSRAFTKFGHIFCHSCSSLYSLNQVCPICDIVYTESEKNHLAQCIECKEYIHRKCDQSQHWSTINGSLYYCPRCIAKLKRFVAKDRISLGHLEAVGIISPQASIEIDTTLKGVENPIQKKFYTHLKRVQFSTSRSYDSFCPPKDTFETWLDRYISLVALFCPLVKKKVIHNLWIDKTRFRTLLKKYKAFLQSYIEKSNSVNGIAPDDSEEVEDVVFVHSLTDLHSIIDLSLCKSCGTSGKCNEILQCSDCAESYHFFCIDVPQELVALNHSPTLLPAQKWRCPACKICLVCKHSSNENEILCCEQCDNGFHTFCLTPKLSFIPSGKWLCNQCFVCHHCRQRGVGSGTVDNRFLYDYTLCNDCIVSHPPTKTICAPTSSSEKLSVSTCNNFIAPLFPDSRRCFYCQNSEGNPEMGRLLFVRPNTWIHRFCLGFFKPHPSARTPLFSFPQSEKKRPKCIVCTKPGANIFCFHQNCPKAVHFTCFSGHLFYCPSHSSTGLIPPPLPPYHRYILHDTQLGSYCPTNLTEISRCGNLTLVHLGTLLPHPNFSTASNLYPYNYHSIRRFWCVHNPTHIALYHCRISLPSHVPDDSGLIFSDPDVRPIFTIEYFRCSQCYQGNHYRGIYKDISIEGAYQLFVSSFQINEHMVINRGVDFFGLSLPHIRSFLGKQSSSLHQSPIRTKMANKFKCLVKPLREKIILSEKRMSKYGCARIAPSLEKENIVQYIRSFLDNLIKYVIYASFSKNKAQKMQEKKEGKVILLHLERERLERLSKGSNGTNRQHFQKKKKLTPTQRCLSDLLLELIYNSVDLSISSSKALNDHNIFFFKEKKASMSSELSLRASNLYREMLSNPIKLVVKPSGIQGWGVFAGEDIQTGTFLLEYYGELIRPIMANKRENFYRTNNIQDYLFCLDDEFIIDATMRGGICRFANHCCDPNCYTQVIHTNLEKKVVLISNRPIKRGEEIVYDYKFPLEENKIPCNCGSKKCKWFLN